MPKLLSYSLRSLWARRTTTLATAAGIALLVLVLAASGMLASGMRHTIASAGDASRALTLQHDMWAEQGSRIPQSILARAGAAPGVRLDAAGQPLVTGEVVSQQVIGDIARRASTVQVRGVAANVLDVRTNVRISNGRAIHSGTAEAVIGRAVAQRHPELTLGSAIELAPGRPLRIVGSFESGGSMLESEVWVDLLSAQSALRMEGQLSSVTAQLRDADAFDAFASALAADKQTGLDVKRESVHYEGISGGMADLIATLGAVEAIIFSLGAVCATMIVAYSSVAQRRREVGVLRALGFGAPSVLAAFIVESLALALASAVVGVGLALLTPWFDFTTIDLNSGTDVAFHFRPDPRALLTAAGVAAAVGLVGGTIPALRAARMHPVLAMRE